MAQRFSYDTFGIITTTDTNWTSLEPGFEVPEGTSSRMDVRILASDYGGNSANWNIRAVIQRFIGQAPTIVGGGSYSVTKEATGASLWDARLFVYNDLIKVDVKGSGLRAIDWLFVGQDPIPLFGTESQSSLITDLISYWKLDEVSGIRYDSIGGNHLTDNNTVGSTTGIIGNAASCVALNSEYLSVADNDSLSVEDQDFTASFWINLADFLVFNGPCGKSGAGASGEWACYINMGTGTVQMYILSGGAVQKDLTGPAITAGSWNHVLLDYVSSSKAMSIAVNNGTPTTGTNTGVNPVASTASFEIGRVVGGNYLNGAVDEVGFWKRILTTDERTALYNSGAGLTYPF